MNADNIKIPQEKLQRELAVRNTFMSMNRGHQSIYKNMAKALELQPEDDLLEVCCGNGYFLKNYASHVHSVAGLDFQELAVKLSTRMNKDRVTMGTAEFVQGDASQLPWEDNKFSVVTAMGSFAGFSNPPDILGEMYRVLRPEGRTIIGIEWNAEDGKDYSKLVSNGYQIWSEDEVNTMFKEAGFSDVTFTYAKTLPNPKMMMVRGIKR
jgi:ubiquinone/menaquinone biosynthesis C-methylase UbiE